MDISEISDFLLQSRRNQLFPSASVAVYRNNKTVYVNSGPVHPEMNTGDVNENTMFDIASITKPVATTTAILILHDQHILNIEKPVSEYLHEFSQYPDKKNVTIRHLMTHTSGLPAWLPLFQFCMSRTDMITFLASQPLKTSPGTTVEYSCMGFVLLAEIVSRLTHQSLSKFCKSRIFDPLQMTQTLFNPGPELKNGIVPTEKGNRHELLLAQNAGYKITRIRNNLIHSEVHDSNAWAANGEGGNAGLFSTASDLIRFGRFLLELDKFPHILSPALKRLAVINQTSALNAQRGFGWQMASSSSATQGILPDSAYGHNGFTGTSLWIDPIHMKIFVFLTNRVYFQNKGNDFNSVRAQLHNIISS